MGFAELIHPRGVSASADVWAARDSPRAKPQLMKVHARLGGASACSVGIDHIGKLKQKIIADSELIVVLHSSHEVYIA